MGLNSDWQPYRPGDTPLELAQYEAQLQARRAREQLQAQRRGGGGGPRKIPTLVWLLGLVLLLALGLALASGG